jgi:hypothetical protein
MAEPDDFELMRDVVAAGVANTRVAMSIAADISVW